MKETSHGRLRIIKWCMIAIIAYSLVLYLLYSGGFFRNMKKNAILAQLNLPLTDRCSLIANEKYYDFLRYTDSYNWSIINYSDYFENRDLISETIKSNKSWNYEQVSWNDIQSLTDVLPADGRGFHKLIPSLNTNYDAWYFQSPADSSIRTGNPATIETLISYCEKANIYSYSIAFFDKEQGCIWFFQLN